MNRRLVIMGRESLRRVYEGFKALSPDGRSRMRAFHESRKASISELDDWTRSAPAMPVAAKRVLIDGMWDNANYWMRFAILRRALHLYSAHEVGVLGKHSRRIVRETFSGFGIDDLIDLHALTKSRKKHLKRARQLLAATKSSEEILSWSLPHDFPGTLVFDGILKRQRRATLDLEDPLLPEYIAEALAYIEAAYEIVSDANFDLVLVSHCVNYTYAALAWAAFRNNIPVVVVYGSYGTVRFMRLSTEDDFFRYPGRPSKSEMINLPTAAARNLAKLGALQIEGRLHGKTSDIGSLYAYKKRQTQIGRKELCTHYSWDPDKPTIGVYASNWFDYPHGSGLESFLDFYDWIRVTLEVASERKDVNWMFKAHPCDDWYPEVQGPRLDQLVAQANVPHIKLAEKSWNGSDLIHCLDGFITCHGTIGIEAGCFGKPVLTAYPGWYGHAGFSNSPNTREDYISALRSDWWTELAPDAVNKSQVFAGWHFCVPDWHGEYLFRDDSEQEENFSDLSGFLARNESALVKEVETVGDWYRSNHRYYHIYKMGRSREFQTTHETQNGNRIASTETFDRSLIA